MNEETILTEPSLLTCDDDDDIQLPLVYIDGEIYAVQDGQLQKLDITQIENIKILDDRDIDKQNEQLSLLENEDSFIDNLETLENDENNIENLDEDEYLDSQDELQQNSDLDIKDFAMLEEEEEVPKNPANTTHETLDKINDFVEVVTAFKCKICPYTTQDRTELLKHFETTHTNPPAIETNQDKSKNDQVKLLYMCGECSSCFPSMENCREHMIKDHQLMDKSTPKKSSNHQDPSPPEKPSSRQTKTLNKTSKPQTNDESKIEIKDKNFKCKIKGCIYSFSTKELMEQHKSCHTELSGSNSFKCPQCPDEKFTKWKVCNLHLWKNHNIDIDLFSCPICNKYKSTTIVKLSTHMKVHSDKREYECNECGKCFKQSSQLRNHKVMHIDRKTGDLPRWYTSKTCEMCGKTYADSKCLKNHMQSVHLKLKPYVCNICGHSSARKAMLQMHKRQHTGDKPFTCTICDYKTGDHNSLRRHVMRHTGNRRYRCPHCPYTAIQSSSYKNHLRSKHPDLSGVFTCNQCSFETVRNDSFIEHVAGHKRGLIKTVVDDDDKRKKLNTNNCDGEVDLFPANIAAAQLVYRYFGASSKIDKTSLMSSSTSADGTSQTITIQIPAKDVDGSMSIASTNGNGDLAGEQDDDETMHCFLKIPHEEEENIDTGGITIPAEPEEDDDDDSVLLNVEC